MSPLYQPWSPSTHYNAELPPLRWIIDGLLPAGALTLFIAREKSGKTLLSTDAVCSIVSDEPFLDRAVRTGPVVFVVLEEHLREPRTRFQLRLDNRDDLPLYTLPANGSTEDVFRLDDPDAMNAFADMIEEYGAVAVIIDTMREAYRLRENESDDMAALVRPLRQIAHQTDCAIVRLHHMSMAGNARGSIAIVAAADQIWTFERIDRGADQESSWPVGRLSVEGRFGPPLHLKIRLGDKLRWQIDNATNEPEDLTARDRILTLLRGASDGLIAQEITDRLGPNASLKTVQNQLSVILHEDPCPHIVQGTGKRNDSRRYLSAARELLPLSEPLGELSGEW